MLLQNLLNIQQIKTIKNLSIIQYKSLIRFRSKKLHQLLTQLEYQVYSSPNVLVVFGTLMYAKDCNKKIKTTLDFLDYLKTKINKFIENEHFDFLIYSIEIHRGYKTFLKKENNKLITFHTFSEEVDSLFGYPHIHFLIKKNLYYSHESLKKSYQNTYINNLYEKFKDFDCNFQVIKQNEVNFIFKKKFLYILKESKLKEKFCENAHILFIKNDKYLNIFYIINNLINIKLINLTSNKMLILKNNMWEFNYNLSIVTNLIECLTYYIKFYAFKIYKNDLYARYKNSKYTWVFYQQFDNFISDLAIKKIKDIDFIYKHLYLINKIIIQKQSFLFDNLDFDSFRYIEYNDFIIDCFSKEFIIFKKNLKNKITSFKYYNIKFKDIKKKNFILQKILYNEVVSLEENNEIFYLFCKTMGTFICSSTAKKGEALYLSGVPSSGKSILTEEYFVGLYTLNNIGLINFSDKKYALEQAVDKKILLINEYKHTAALHELMLKILDKSLIELNIKYKSSKMIQIKGHSAIISNKSPIEQKFDAAMNVRIKSFNFFDSFLNKNITYDVAIEEFPSLTCLYVFAYYNTKEQFFFNKNIFRINYTRATLSLEYKK